MSRKKQIQKDLRLKLSITVDVVKQGAGTTNTGNVARCFFEKAEAVAKITGVNANLIVRLHTILQVVTSVKEVNCGKFKEYCLNTANVCVALYPWYKMPPPVHKVLIHGSDIIQALGLPIGWLSDRKLTNEDLIHHMLILSCPLISSLRKQNVKKHKALSLEAQKLLYV